MRPGHKLKNGKTLIVRRVDADARDLLSSVVTTYPHTVWLADVDDTLIDTAGMHNAASSSIVGVLGQFVGEKKAEQVVRRFAEIFQILVTSHQSSERHEATRIEETRKSDCELEARIDECQQEIRQRWGTTKKFSREMLLKLAGEDCGAALTPQQIQQCADHYWQHLESHVICFDDAIRLTEDLARAGSPLFLFTSSDGRLIPKENGHFDYDPESSHRFKEARVEKLRAKGLRYQSVFIGDPIDKPTPEFYKMVYSSVERNLHRHLDPRNVIVLGDSYRSDLEIPVSDWKVALGILYRPGQEDVIAEQERIVSVGNWKIISELLPAR